MVDDKSVSTRNGGRACLDMQRKWIWWGETLKKVNARNTKILAVGVSLYRAIGSVVQARKVRISDVNSTSFRNYGTEAGRAPYVLYHGTKRGSVILQQLLHIATRFSVLI